MHACPPFGYRSLPAAPNERPLFGAQSHGLDVSSGPAQTGLTPAGNGAQKRPLGAHCTCAGGTLKPDRCNFENGAPKLLISLGDQVATTLEELSS